MHAMECAPSLHAPSDGEERVHRTRLRHAPGKGAGNAIEDICIKRLFLVRVCVCAFYESLVAFYVLSVSACWASIDLRNCTKCLFLNKAKNEEGDLRKRQPRGRRNKVRQTTISSNAQKRWKGEERTNKTESWGGGPPLRRRRFFLNARLCFSASSRRRIKIGLKIDEGPVPASKRLLLLGGGQAAKKG
jgi:hypothetical protein